jgi:hypothetical protein
MGTPARRKAASENRRDYQDRLPRRRTAQITHASTDAGECKPGVAAYDKGAAHRNSSRQPSSNFDNPRTVTRAPARSSHQTPAMNPNDAA